MGAFGIEWDRLQDEAMKRRWMIADIEEYGAIDYSIWDY